MDFWKFLYIVDWTLFAIAAITVFYMLVYTIAALFLRRGDIPKSKYQNRFIILIPSYKNSSVEQTVMSALAQSYPQRLFDITVISDHNTEITNFHLAQQPVTLLTPNFETSTKAKSLQLAINNLPQFKIYDIVVILDAGNIIENDFLERMNDAMETAGTKAIQAHRLSRNRDTAAARMDAIFEEINNTIFRRGHIALGLSAAIAGSGMAFDFNWFKTNIMNTKATWEDKELEALLMRQHIYVDYFDDIYVFDEKTRNATDFNRQRGRWIKTQIFSALHNVKYLPVAIFNQHYDWADKIIQWLLLPRMILMALIIGMGVILPFVYLTLALKWWGLFAAVLLVFAMATPDYLVDKYWNSTFLRSPLILMQSIPGLRHVVALFETAEKRIKAISGRSK